MSSHIKIHQINQNSDQWHEIRSGLITASNALDFLRKGMMGVAYIDSDGNTTLKTAAIEKNKSDFGGNFSTERGHLLEVEALDLYRRIYECEVLEVGFITNDKYPIFGYSPDGMNVTEDGLVEVKAFNAKKHLKIQEEDDIPTEVLAQIQFGMLVSEKKFCDVVFYHPPNKEKGVNAFNALKIIRVKLNTRTKRLFLERLK